MKNKITKLSFILLLGIFSTTKMNAQTEEDVRLITKDYDIEALKQLEEQFDREYKENYAKGLEIARKRNLPIEGVDEQGRSFSLQGVVPGTDYLKYYQSNNNVSAKSSIQTARVQHLHNNGSLGLNIEGQSMNIGIWDNGQVFAGHQSFGAARVTSKDGTSSLGDHATHVGGTIAGNGVILDVKGMAPQAVLWSNDWNNDRTEMTAQAADGLLVSNHSYGANYVALNLHNNPAGFGKYNSDARSLDLLLFAAERYLPVIAAGNARNGDYIGGQTYYFNTSKGGADLMHGDAVSKNAVVVAAVEGVTNYQQPSDVVMSNFSQWGPTDDFRIKPDISAKGVAVKSATLKKDSNNNNDPTATEINQGTSMAAPSVTGVFALWQQYYKLLYPTRGSMRAATIKALMAISADEAGTADGPDHRFGWGLINAKRGAEIIRDSRDTPARVGITEIQELKLDDQDFYEIKVNTDGSMPLKAAIAWTDPAAPVNLGSVDDATPALVNDLDLRIIRPNGQEVLPWALTKQFNNLHAVRADNDVDPIEVVEYKGTASGVAGAGEYTIRVTHKGTLTNGSQNFSLIIYGMKEGLSVKKESFDNLNVYPNPATDIVNISADLISIVDAKVELYDMAGKRVYENSGLFNNTD
ncbi:MAG TPA: S8 family serine peptidase, partial [Chitinophagaceae bacterium]|nr:S8 family serine peptidase [Chitinophagaceae bacterium]